MDSSRVPSSTVEQRPFKPWVLGSNPRGLIERTFSLVKLQKSRLEWFDFLLGSGEEVALLKTVSCTVKRGNPDAIVWFHITLS